MTSVNGKSFSKGSPQEYARYDQIRSIGRIKGRVWSGANGLQFECLSQQRFVRGSGWNMPVGGLERLFIGHNAQNRPEAG